MSDDPRTGPADDPFEPLFAGVARRPQPDEAASERAFAAVTEEWESLQSRRPRRRRLAPLAMAATFIAGVVGFFLLQQPAPVPRELAVELAQGHIRVNDQAFRATGDPVTVTTARDESIRVMGASRWQTADGTDVRVSNGSTFAWRTPTAIALHEGQVYVAIDGGGAFAVTTPHGLVTDLGTRFLVATDHERVEVAVREGRVEIATPLEIRRSQPVARGYAQLLLAEDGGIVERTEAASHQRWNWIHTAATGYTTRNPVTMLHEIARDLGKNLQFADGVDASLQIEDSMAILRGCRPGRRCTRSSMSLRLNGMNRNGVITIAFNN